MKLVAAEGALLEAVLGASYPQWNEGLSRRAYARWWDAQLQTAWGRANLHRYALLDADRVAASAKRYDFDAVLEGRRVRVMGIGAVFTQLDARSRGHARTLVDRMMEAGTAERFDYALLFSEIGADYYARLGFEPLPIREVTLRVAFKHGAPATLVRAGESRDLAAIAEIGRVRAAQYRWHLDRGVDLIQHAIAKKRLLAGLGPAGLRELHFFVAEEGAAAVAYLVFTAHGGVWTIEECGDRDPAGARVGAMLQVLLAREPAERPPAIRGWLPPGFTPPQVTITASAPPTEVMMVRPLAPGFSIDPPLGPDDVLYWHGDVF